MNRPLALVCYICGREFGTKSLSIHLKACQKKWENQQNHKPPKQRRTCPSAPPGFEELISKSNITREDIINFNNGSFNQYMEKALVQCQYCGRKFNQKSLIPHQKACKNDPMIRKPYVPKEEKTIQKISEKTGYKLKLEEKDTNMQNLDLVPCFKCGRKFNSDRVSKHEKVCKEKKKQQKKQVNSHIIFQPNPINTKPNLQKKKSPGFQKQPKWKVQHQQFQNAIKAMRQIRAVEAKGGNVRDLPPPPPSNYDHYIPCKYCGRKYAPDVAQRHIPKCANIINKPGGIKASKIQEKYVGSSGVKKVEVPIKKIETPVKTYQLTKNNGKRQEVELIKSNFLKPNLKSPLGAGSRKW